MVVDRRVGFCLPLALAAGRHPGVRQTGRGPWPAPAAHSYTGRHSLSDSSNQPHHFSAGPKQAQKANHQGGDQRVTP